MKIILVGAGGSGKDYIRKKLMEKGLKYAISCTSRPKREGEQDGKDYKFLSKEQFKELISKEQFLQYQEFNGNYYGTLLSDWNNNDLFIMNVDGIRKLNPDYRSEAIIMYVKCDQNKIFDRMLMREPNLSDNEKEKLKVRINLDKENFQDFRDYDLIIDNN